MILDNKGKMFEDRRKENKQVKNGKREEDRKTNKEKANKKQHFVELENGTVLFSIFALAKRKKLCYNNLQLKIKAV